MDLERLFHLKLVGEEALAGRATWKVEATPKPALNTRRTLWFDQAEGVERRRLDHFLRATNGFQPGSEIEMQFR